MKKSERNASSLVKKIIRIIIGAIALIIQGAIFYLIFFSLPQYQPIYLIMEILAIITVLVIFKQNANSSYKLSWTIVILLLPFGGIILYLAYGRGRALPQRKHKKLINYLELYSKKESGTKIIDLDLKYQKMINLIENSTNEQLYINNNCLFLEDGMRFFDEFLNVIKKAEKYIFLEYFIIKEGIMWNEIKSILIDKAKNGVEIKIIYDDIGSRKGMFAPSIKRIEGVENIKMVPFNPLGFNLSLSINYRDHRKILVVDGKYAIVGGINIGDEYIHVEKRFGYWRDNALFIEGDAVISYISMFSSTWFLSTKEMLIIDNYVSKNNLVNNKGYMIGIGDGPSVNSNPTYDLFLSMFNNAEKYIYISTPYFIIDTEFINTLVLAIKSGIDVRILLPHIPDKKTVFMMTKSNYGDILRAGGKIYEYTPGFNHAKNVICDDEYAFIGTVNADYRSFFLHFECGAFVIDMPAIRSMKNDFLEALNVSKEITLDEWEKRSKISKIFETILGITSPLM